MEGSAYGQAAESSGPQYIFWNGGKRTDLAGKYSKRSRFLRAVFLSLFRRLYL